MVYKTVPYKIDKEPFFEGYLFIKSFLFSKKKEKVL